LSSPDILALLKPSVAEEICNVMSEDEVDTNPVLYGRHASPFVRRVAVTLQLYGIDYDHVPLMPFGPDKAELAAFNPIARVPALKCGHSRSSRPGGGRAVADTSRRCQAPPRADAAGYRARCQ
jgi:hypothetical protein